jgi:hypothetical protein
MEVRDQPLAPAAVHPRKETPVSIGQEAMREKKKIVVITF